MTKDEIKQKIQDIGTCEDITTVRSMLADFQTSLEADYDAHEETTTKNTTYQQQIDQLQKDNMKLFLKIGDPTKPEQNDQPKERRKFGSLFDEKGGLK